MKKRMLGLVLVLMMTACALTGCADSGTETAGKEESTASEAVETGDTETGEKVHLQFTYFEDNEAAIELYEKMIAQFNEESENIEVEFVPIIDDYEKKLLVMVASGTAPDVAWVGEEMIGEYAGQGALLNLDEYDGTAFNSSDYIACLLYTSYRKKAGKPW